jgi:cell division septal protein FtsQ
MIAIVAFNKMEIAIKERTAEGIWRREPQKCVIL